MQEAEVVIVVPGATVVGRFIFEADHVVSVDGRIVIQYAGVELHVQVVVPVFRIVFVA